MGTLAVVFLWMAASGVKGASQAPHSQVDCQVYEQYHDFQCIPFEKWDADDICSKDWSVDYGKTCLRANLQGL